METVLKMLGYLWLGIWIICSLLILFLLAYVCVRFYPEFISFGIGKMAALSVVGLLLLGVLVSLGVVTLDFILGDMIKQVE